MRRLIIDADPGVDDAIALLMALSAPDAEVLGITIVGGNVPLARGVRNALALVDYVGRSETPVFRGSSRPLKGSFPYALHFHGGAGITRRLPRPTTLPNPRPSVDFLAEQLSSYPKEIALVALGPLTNLARLERRHPGALKRFADITVMGGAVDCPGNVTPEAEFNFYSDPQAAYEVMAAGAPLTLVDLAACRQVAIGRDSAFSLRSQNRAGRLALEIVRNWFKRDAARQSMLNYDQLAMAAAFYPQVIAARPTTIGVETQGPAAGASKAMGKTGPVALAGKVDADHFFALMGQWLGWTGSGAGFSP